MTITQAEAEFRATEPAITETATDADFTVAPHTHNPGFQAGGLKVCIVCGALGRSTVIWGRAPGQPAAGTGAGRHRKEQS